MNITLKIERPVSSFFWNSLRGVSRSPVTVVKDDPYTNFAIKQKAETIHQLLGLKVSKAKILLKKDRALAQKPLAHYIKIGQVLEPFKPIFGQINDSTNLLLSPPWVIHRNCQFLHECGTRKAPADIIAGCQNFMTVPVGVFKSYAHIEETLNIQKQWLALIPQPLWMEESRKCLEKYCNSWSSIAHTRNVLFASFVSQKWNMPFEDIFEWVEEGLKALPLSLGRLIRVLDVLEEIGFDQSKMWRYPKLLQSDPSSLDLFVRTYKDDFLGQNAIQFLLEHPAVTYQINFANLHTNVDTLRKFGVPAVCIRTNLTSLLNHDSVTLQEKLRQMEPYPELGVFVHHPKFAKLFEDVDTVVLRVETFRAIDKRQITFTACTCSAKEFSAIIQQRAQLRLSDEAMGYLANQTGQPKMKIRDVLRLHPQSRQLSSENMKKVVELITSKGFTKEQVFNGLHLVLYPVDLVAKKLAELPSRPDMQPIEVTLKEPAILQIVLYLLEEQFLFTGNGVFAKPPDKPNQDFVWESEKSKRK